MIVLTIDIGLFFEISLGIGVPGIPVNSCHIVLSTLALVRTSVVNNSVVIAHISG
jgi:hypothetical protein